MKISVLVPTLGTREKEIRRLLETLEKQSYKQLYGNIKNMIEKNC